MEILKPNFNTTGEEIRNWIIQNLQDIDFKNKEIMNLFDYVLKYIFNKDLTEIEYTDAILLIVILSHKSAQEFGVLKELNIKILPKEQYVEKYGDTSFGFCSYDNNIVYCGKLIEDIMSGNLTKFIRSLQTIIHEVAHLWQNKHVMNCLIDVKELTHIKYIFSLETIVRMADSKFYEKNYKHLLKENDAEKKGLQLLMKYLNLYGYKIYKRIDENKINQKLNSYDDNFYNSEFEILGEIGDAIEQMDMVASEYILKKPNLLYKFPFLLLAYNEDGKKKSILELIENRNSIRDDNKSEEIDIIYYIIANLKNFHLSDKNIIDNEINDITKYIYENISSDLFLYDLLNYRLKIKGLNNFQIDQYINNITVNVRQIELQKLMNSVK